MAARDRGGGASQELGQSRAAAAAGAATARGDGGGVGTPRGRGGSAAQSRKTRGVAVTRCRGAELGNRTE